MILQISPASFPWAWPILTLQHSLVRAKYAESRWWKMPGPWANGTQMTKAAQINTIMISHWIFYVWQVISLYTYSFNQSITMCWIEHCSYKHSSVARRPLFKSQLPCLLAIWLLSASVSPSRKMRNIINSYLLHWVERIKRANMCRSLTILLSPYKVPCKYLLLLLLYVRHCSKEWRDSKE